MDDRQLAEYGRKDKRDQGDKTYNLLWKSDAVGDGNHDQHAKVGSTEQTGNGKTHERA